MSPGRILAGKYRVEGVVGMGGMGVVVSAEHLQLQQKVAIKLISMSNLTDAQQADARRRFVREGQAAAKLTSDHVVRIFDVGTLDNGAPFMVMELLRGEDLAAMIDRRGPAPVDVAVGYLLQACDALLEAHAHGIVHRDLKPANLFAVRRPDGRTTIKVLDFGISKLVSADGERLDASLTSTRTVVGSPHYMSPEQVRNAKAVDARTDIWALGAVFYELLVARPAFDADTLPGICAAIAADTPPPIRDTRPEVPEELERIVMRCLEKEPKKRFGSVLELITALQPFAPARGSSSSIDYVGAPPAAGSTAALEFSLVSTNPPPPDDALQASAAAAQSASMSVEALAASRAQTPSDRSLTLIGVVLGIALGAAALAGAFGHFSRDDGSVRRQVTSTAAQPPPARAQTIAEPPAAPVAATPTPAPNAAGAAAVHAPPVEPTRTRPARARPAARRSGRKAAEDVVTSAPAPATPDIRLER